MHSWTTDVASSLQHHVLVPIATKTRSFAEANPILFVRQRSTSGLTSHINNPDVPNNLRRTLNYPDRVLHVGCPSWQHRQHADISQRVRLDAHDAHHRRRRNIHPTLNARHRSLWRYVRCYTLSARR